MQNVTTRDWYGYGGSWGEIGNIKLTSGPWGPGDYKPAPKFGVNKCGTNHQNPKVLAMTQSTIRTASDNICSR